MGNRYLCLPRRCGQFCRTPNAGNANNVRNCNTGNGGALNNNNANNSNGVAPIGGIARFEYHSGKAVRLPQGVVFQSPLKERSETDKDAKFLRELDYKPW